MPLISFDDTPKDVVMKMAQGNIGALTCCIELLKHTAEIDPESAMGNFGTVLMFDEWDIRGVNIYILWNDICKRDTRDLVMLVRAVQLGFLSREELTTLSADNPGQRTTYDIGPVDAKVCERLVQFQPRKVRIPS